MTANSSNPNYFNEANLAFLQQLIFHHVRHWGHSFVSITSDWQLKSEETSSIPAPLFFLTTLNTSSFAATSFEL